ncbi:MAG TPA: hypothetical protein VFA22_00675 [Stellaceae bacterium]|nr:hypothetical protein [Stellaceae bacterium]
MTDGERLSRRSLLAGAAVAACVTPARADDKVSKEEAKYQAMPKGQQRCGICLQFQPPNQCRIVQGPVVPTGWCQFFAARENAH